MPFEIIRQDITNMKTDAIVNPTNNELKPTSGVCGAIFEKAGYEILEKKCKKIGYLETTEAVITKGYNLDCKYIIHTVGPIWDNAKSDNATLLYNTYTNCLKLAKSKKCNSIAFPLISSGDFGYPKDEALDIATNAIKNFLLENDMLIYLVVFDRKSFKINKDLFDSITQYIDDHYIDIYKFKRPKRNIDSFDDVYPSFYITKVDKREQKQKKSKLLSKTKSLLETNEESQHIYDEIEYEKSLLDALSHAEDTFSQYLLKLIDSSGMTDAQVYKKANIDRRLFSKIRNNKDYTPSKPTVLSLAIALELNLDKTNDLLRKAGFALSHSNKFDIIIEYFISNQIYDIYKINETLFSFDQNILRT